MQRKENKNIIKILNRVYDNLKTENPGKNQDTKML